LFDAIRNTNKKIRVLVIDDSPLVRSIIADLLQAEGDIEVIATGKTGLDCLELSEKLTPDIVTLDIEMPIMDGLTALEQLQNRKIKPGVLMLSVLTQHGAKATFRALELGAYDFVPKPSSSMKIELNELGQLLRERIRGYFEYKEKKKKDRIRVKVGNFPQISKFFQPVKVKETQRAIKAIGFGTSTGGPNALYSLFKQIPSGLDVPVFVVQHMPAGFTKAFAERLDDFSQIKVKEAEDGEVVVPGTAYIAPGNFHLRVTRKEKNICIALDQSNLVNGHRPSVDVLFDSLLEEYESALVGVIMTGMGKDGALAMKRIKEKGGSTIAQDEKTSVIFGMNRQAILNGAIDYIVPLDEIVPYIIRIMKERGI
jgi:two-component system, chemotaxis family, protein-glutamate methylesterase/glutaminase